MIPIEISSTDFLPVLPAAILTVGACLLLLTEVFLKSGSRAYQSVLTCAFAVLAGLVAVWVGFEPAQPVFGGFGALDPFSSFVSAVVCVGLALAALSSAGFLRRRNAERGEFYALMMFATAGMSLLAISTELITLFVNLEVMSVATYALTSYLRRGVRPAEAGFKYFILGAFSSAVLLYGASLVYGATGTTHFMQMGEPLRASLADPAMRGVALIGLMLVGAGFAFKVAAVPFHMWTPDVYEGAPTPVTALMSTGVKAAAFAALVRFFISVGPSIPSEVLVGLFSILALLTMVVGNLLAIPQQNVKRMLAYSSIAHAGYLMLGVAALFANGGTATPDTEGGALRLFQSTQLIAQPTSVPELQADALRGILFYLLAYTVTALGAFAALGALERREDEERGTAWDLERFAGLAQRRPGWALAMGAFMLSLGGLPPTIGFIGKLLVFRSAIDAGLVGLAAVGILTSAAGVYYYLRVVVYMFMRPVPEGAELPERLWGTEAVLLISSAAVVLLGLLPNLLSDWVGSAGALLGM